MVSPFLPDDEKVRAVREALPATSAGIYLDTAAAGPMPRETALAMAEVADRELAIGRAHGLLVDETAQRLDEARASVAAVLSADIDAVALTHSVADGVATVVQGITWRPGDAVVMTSLDAPPVLRPLRAAAERFGLEVRVVEVADRADDDEVLARFEAALRPGVRLVSLPHVATSTGRVFPLREIADLAHGRGGLVLADGSAAAGALRVDADDLGADAYALPGSAWLLGPEGMGALWLGPAARERLLPPMAPAGGGIPLPVAGSQAPGRIGPPVAGVSAFDASDFHRPSVVGLARSCGWLSMHVGLGWIFERASSLARAAADRLAVIPGVELVTPSDRMGTIVAFRVERWEPEEVAEQLGRRIFAMVGTPPDRRLVRLSVGFFNTEAEIERVVDCVRELAARTPATMPPPRSLTMLGEEAQ